ncbi:MAG: DNA mismatch repair protein MutS [Rhodothermia bacterium]|nr:DNA mismatch repair protein MutS [Rhodothermia bacterium]
MRQYYRIKDRHPGALLLFRMGDFYETFDDDAVKVSRILGITLTKRANGKASEVPLAGFPHHALDTYLPKLVRAGERVAICEQLEEPSKAKKIVKRDVVETVTPGVSFRDQLLDPKVANYLGSVHWPEKSANLVGVSFLDASTGEFVVAEVPEHEMLELLQTNAPAELIVSAPHRDRALSLRGVDAMVTPIDDWVFTYDYSLETLLQHFDTHSLKGFGVEDLKYGIVAAGAALHYLAESQKGKVGQIRKIVRHTGDEYMLLDQQTRRNLELISPMQGGDGSLVDILDHTRTPMGGRRLRQWMIRPLRSVDRINRRLDAVGRLSEDRRRLEVLAEELEGIGDLERLAARACTGRANPRDVVEIKRSLGVVPKLKAVLSDEEDPVLNKIGRELDPCDVLVDRIAACLEEAPPLTVSDGGLIKRGFDEELDELRDVAKSSREWLMRLQKKEAEETGISSLKIGYNKVFGYYLEVTNTHRDKVPEHFIRKQTLVNAERYITPELKEFEERILTADEKILDIEARIFRNLRDYVADFTVQLQDNAAHIAVLDCLASFAIAAIELGYVRPTVDDTRALEITEGRHPVVERTLPLGEPFIPNSLDIDPDREQILVITGPNMAGKSVVLRQVGLIVLMAQIGSYVPVKSARVGIVDRIFTRVGASDNLSAGESTFLVEMNETANILNNATRRSLILLDEVGRGTSTFDGMSIAWALVEYLHDHAAVAARTLFATHYHELNDLAEQLPRVFNFRIQVQEHDGRVVFLRKLVPGGADHSYGIEVARMAGLPHSLINRARSILARLESQHSGQAIIDDRGEKVDASDDFQMTLFESDPVLMEIKEALDKLDPDRMTPVEALLKLAELKDRAR